MSERAVVVLSGGQDSTTSLYWARQQFIVARAVTFDYGQRHRSEIEAAKAIADRAHVAHSIVEVPVLPQFPSSSLTDDVGAHGVGGYVGLPGSFTPGRNVIFLTQAAAIAYRLDAHHLVTGVCQTDFSGYPDCRRSTIDAVQHALALGMEWPLVIHTPVMYLTKAETVQLARSLDGCWEALRLSVTCYDGKRPGCGKCPACVIRAKGFREAGELDPALV